MTLHPADPSFEAKLRAALPEGSLRPFTPAYGTEPRGRYTATDALVAAPRTARDVAKVVRACAEARVPVVPFGGGTGLVGGQIAPDLPRPVLLSLERMNRVGPTYPAENLLHAEAGATLQAVRDAAAAQDRLFPLAIASQGSAQMGGILSTNAGGVNVLRYGNARDLCVGIEAVLPDGSLWNGLKRLRKDNTGYDLRNLLIGAEGSLGIITAATVRLMPRPRARAAALLVVESPSTALELLALAQNRLGPAVQAFELISGTGLHFLRETLPDLRQPFTTPPEWLVLIDIGTPDDSATPALEALFTEAHQRGLTSDGLLSQSDQDRTDFWHLRETIPEGNKRIGSISSHDISVPLSNIPRFIDQATKEIAHMGDFRVNCFGHLGDGNLHFNVFPPKGTDRAAYDAQRAEIQRRVHDIVRDFDGSFSAEHGVGRLKVADLERYGDPAKLAVMRAIKAALDPAGIMNPGAVLRAP